MLCVVLQTKVGVGVLCVYIGVLDMLMQANVGRCIVCSDAGKCR